MSCIGCGQPYYSLRNICSGCYRVLTTDEMQDYYAARLSDSDVISLLAGRGVVYNPQDGETFERDVLPMRCLAKYEQHIDTIRRVAREHGYAIGVHGSLRRDIDLIAAPWTKEASDGATLAEAIAGAVGGIIEAGKELGLPPMYALSNLTFTNGRLGIMGDAAKALIRASGVLEPGTDFTETYTGEEYTPEWTCTVSAQRKGQPKPFERSFSLREAVVSKLIRIDQKEKKILTYTRDGGWSDCGAPWSAWTKRMLMYRPLGFLVRDYFSDVIGGLAIVEELRDYNAGEVATGANGSRETTVPSEPDPLLTGAPVAQVFDAVEVGGVTVVGEPRQGEAPPADAIDASVVEDAPAATPQSASSELGLDEAALIRGIEKLEGQIVSVGSLSELDRVWEQAASIVAQVGERERARLVKLYQQNALGFGPLPEVE